MRSAAARARLRIQTIEVADPATLASRCRGRLGRCDALWLPADPALASENVFRYLLRLSLDSRRPLFTFAEPLVRAGALAAAAPDYGWVGARLADAVRRIESGERAGSVPVTPVRHARLVVNPAAARALGLRLPPSVERRAERVP